MLHLFNRHFISSFNCSNRFELIFRGFYHFLCTRNYDEDNKKELAGRVVRRQVSVVAQIVA